MEVEEKVEEKKSTRKTPNKSKAIVEKIKTEARKSGRKSTPTKMNSNWGLDIESDEELPFPFGTPDHGGYKVCINIVYLYYFIFIYQLGGAGKMELPKIYIIE